MSEYELSKELLEIKKLLNTLVSDVNTMHKFLVGMGNRLSSVEGVCIEHQSPKATPI